MAFRKERFTYKRIKKRRAVYVLRKRRKNGKDDISPNDRGVVSGMGSSVSIGRSD